MENNNIRSYDPDRTDKVTTNNSQNQQDDCINQNAVSENNQIEFNATTQQ